MNKIKPQRDPADLHKVLLGRPPTAGESVPLDAGRLVDHLTGLPEYRNRFRAADPSDDNARMSIALWPPEERAFSLQIVLASAESWSKCRSVIERLAPQLVPGTLLTVLCGEEDEADWTDIPHTELRVYPGYSVFQLRALIPTVLRETAWVALIEDHAVPDADWVETAVAVASRLGPEVLAFTGTATNQVSTTPWSWANFLFNFTQHLAPSAERELPATVATSFFRRDLVGAQSMPVFWMERHILGRRGPVFNEVRVDHVQHTGWWAASTHVFDNGRVSGASIRRLAESPRREVFGSIYVVLGRRMAQIARSLRAHPISGNLPRGTVVRIWWIGFCHSLGVLFGAVVGGGTAHKRLE